MPAVVAADPAEPSAGGPDAELAGGPDADLSGAEAGENHGGALPQLGSQAPDFTLPDVHGTPLHLIERRGRPQLVVFIPFAFSGICTGELSQLHAHRAALDAAGVQVMVISCDPMFALRAWEEQSGFGFDLLSDFWPHGQVAQRYGVFDTVVGYAKRGSVLIDAHGQVRWTVLTGRGVARPISGYLEAIDELGQTGAGR